MKPELKDYQPITSITELMEANAHLGCSKNKRNSQYSPYLLEIDHKEDIINLKMTYFAIQKACQVLHNIAKNKGEILFLSGSNHSNELIKNYSTLCMQNYMLTWSGGFFTNYESILALSLIHI